MATDTLPIPAQNEYSNKLNPKKDDYLRKVEAYLRAYYLDKKDDKSLMDRLMREGLTCVRGPRKIYVFNGSPLGLRFNYNKDPVEVDYMFISKKILDLWKEGHRGIFAPELQDIADQKTQNMISANHLSLDKMLGVIEKVVQNEQKRPA